MKNWFWNTAVLASAALLAINGPLRANAVPNDNALDTISMVAVEQTVQASKTHSQPATVVLNKWPYKRAATRRK